MKLQSDLYAAVKTFLVSEGIYQETFKEVAFQMHLVVAQMVTDLDAIIKQRR